MDQSNSGLRSSSHLRFARATLAVAAIMIFSAIDASAQIGNFNVNVPNINVGPHIAIDPNVRYSPNVNYDGYDGSRPRPQPRPTKKAQADDLQRAAPAARGPVDNSYVAKEVLIEVDGKPTEAQVDGLARRHRLTRTQSQNFALTNSTFFRWKISDDRSVDAVVRELIDSGDVKDAQRNNIFNLQQDAGSTQALSPESDLSQYELAKMRIPQAHALSVGKDIKIAVIDSGIDMSHPELTGVIAGSFDALASAEGPHPHGTSVASVICAHARLTGTAAGNPCVRCAKGRRGKQFVRDSQKSGLCSRQRRADYQYEFFRPEGPGDGARARRRSCQGHYACRYRRQCGAEVGATLSCR
jgi:hypothetical protein